MKDKNYLMDTCDVMQVLDHRYPMLMIDKVVSYDKDSMTLIAKKGVTMNEEYFQGHFPNNPVMPGVYSIEAIGQGGAILFALLNGVYNPLEKKKINSNFSVYFMSITNAKFRAPIQPGCMLTIKVKVVSMRNNAAKITGEVFIDDTILAAEASCTAVIR